MQQQQRRGSDSSSSPKNPDLMKNFSLSSCPSNLNLHSTTTTTTTKGEEESQQCCSDEMAVNEKRAQRRKLYSNWSWSGESLALLGLVGFEKKAKIQSPRATSSSVISPRDLEQYWEMFQSTPGIWDSWAKNEPSKLRSLASKGIPDKHRSWAWLSFIDLTNPIYPSLGERVFLEHSPVVEAQPASQIVAKNEEMINLDLLRTFPKHELFTSPEGKGIRGLSVVLRVYAIYNPSVGYCQGMNFLVGILLMYMEPQSAFTALCYLMEEVGLVNYYCPHSSKELKKEVSRFQSMIEIQLPRLANHFEKYSVHPIIFTSQWFVSFFSCLPDWSTVLFFCDTVFVEGRKAFFKIGLAILVELENCLLNQFSTEDIISILLHPPKQFLNSIKLGEIASSLPIENLLAKALEIELAGR